MELRGLIGLAISSVDFDEESGRWILQFGKSCWASISCPWRVVAEGRVAVTDRDHLQRFGLSAPVDSRTAALERLSNRKVVHAATSDGTGDLCIVFDGGVALETFTDSSGYESGDIQLPTGERVILMGGGESAVFDTPARKDNGT